MFNGQDDPLPWLNRCDQFFRGQQTMEEDKVWLATFHMTGSAQLWYHRLERDTGTPSWRRFVELVNTRFGPPLRINSLGELIALRKQGTVREFSDQFLALLCRTDPLTERQQVQLFTAGLGQPLQTDVELQAPQSLESAMSLARAYERRTQLTVPAAPPPARRPWRPGGPLPVGSSTSPTTNQGGSNASSTEALPRRTLSPPSSNAAVPKAYAIVVTRNSWLDIGANACS